MKIESTERTPDQGEGSAAAGGAGVGRTAQPVAAKAGTAAVEPPAPIAGAAASAHRESPLAQITCGSDRDRQRERRREQRARGRPRCDPSPDAAVHPAAIREVVGQVGQHRVARRALRMPFPTRSRTRSANTAAQLSGQTDERARERRDAVARDDDRLATVPSIGEAAGEDFQHAADASAAPSITPSDTAPAPSTLVRKNGSSG